MKYYFDTSALVKRYIQESGSKVIDRTFDEANEILVSAVTRIEAISAFRRLMGEKNISEADYEKLKSALDKDFEDFTVLPFSHEMLNKAYRIVDEEDLRTLDAIQLATVIIASEMIDQFIVADQRLLSAAERYNIVVIDPLK